MAFHFDDTICAIATAPGSAGRGTIRISGPQAVEVVSHCFQASDGTNICSIARATGLAGSVRIAIDSVDRDLLCDLLIWPTQRSYTREPLVELHTIGSHPLLSALSNSLCQQGARAAVPGEFTLRAFLAGRIDLTQAEAVLGVIDARGNEDLDAALIQLAGGLAHPLRQLREELLQLLAEVEAGLDFVEEDIEFISSGVLKERLIHASHLLSEMAKQMDTRHVTHDLPLIALVGPPNVGKSSLFNALADRYGSAHRTDQEWHIPALVSPQRGTTRDYLTTTILVSEQECELVDTAGIDLGERVEAGISSCKVHFADSSLDLSAQLISTEQGIRSSIRIHCLDISHIFGNGQQSKLRIDSTGKGAVIPVLTKSDLLTDDSFEVKNADGIPYILTSSRTGHGLDQLCRAISRLLRSDELTVRGKIVGATASRCRESICSAIHSIQHAIELVCDRQGNELVAVELRGALDQLGVVVGVVYTDDLLDRIFGTFCIGK